MPRQLPALPTSPSPSKSHSGPPRLRASLLVVLGFVFWVAGGLAPAPTHAAPGRFYPPTGKTLAAEFLAFYDSHGGLPVFGYPIENPRVENGYLVQYCERERLEFHPENAGTPFTVLLGRLGADLTAGRSGEPFTALPPPAYLAADPTYVPETHHRLAGVFLDYWRSHGGLLMFGYPISQEFVENGLRQQWFERARFEYHPELPAAFAVSLGLLGQEDLAALALPITSVNVSAGPTHDRHLQLGLTQGGESQDPAFFHGIVPAIAALHVGRIRLDNIYTHYHVVDRDSNGQLHYDWTALDSVVDDIRAMGAEPLLCLSYTPAALSPDGSPIQPPASLTDWQALVRATVTHFNVDRGLGIHYWEVWNEPDQWDFWRGSWPDYLNFYDATRQAIRSVDPAARVGGPARGSYDPGSLAWFLDHAQQQGAAGGVDFLSWHAYGLPLKTVADQIGTSRNLVAAHPGMNPELAITEFNVLTGGAGDTSQDHRSDTSAGAAYVLSLLDTMERAGLDQAYLFEVKDGPSPAGPYWGRWGIMTNDGRTKPIYHALRAYQNLGTPRLPVQTDGSAGIGAFATASGNRPQVVVWNSGTGAARTRLVLPAQWQDLTYNLTLFDSMHNNPAATGDDHVTPFGRRTGRDLTVDLAPGSFLIVEAP